MILQAVDLNGDGEYLVERDGDVPPYGAVDNTGPRTTATTTEAVTSTVSGSIEGEQAVHDVPGSGRIP